MEGHGGQEARGRRRTGCRWLSPFPASCKANRKRGRRHPSLLAARRRLTVGLDAGSPLVGSGGPHAWPPVNDPWIERISFTMVRMSCPSSEDALRAATASLDYTRVASNVTDGSGANPPFRDSWVARRSVRLGAVRRLEFLSASRRASSSKERSARPRQQAQAVVATSRNAATNLADPWPEEGRNPHQGGFRPCQRVVR